MSASPRKAGSDRVLSLHRRLTLIVGLGVLLLAGSMGAVLAARSEYRERLVERAQFEAERARDRLDASRPSQPLVGDCSVGPTHSGVTEDITSVIAAIDPARVLQGLQRLAGPNQVEVELSERNVHPVVLAMRSGLPGGVAWATVDVTEGPTIREWKVVGAALMGVFALLLYAVFDLLRSVRSGSRLLAESARALGADLSAPVHSPGVEELAVVAESLSTMARALAQTQKERDTLTTELDREQRLGVLGRVCAAVAHEVRNPLAAIKLRADLLHEGTGSEAERRADIEVLRREAERLSRLVTELLTHTRATAPVDCDVGTIVGERVRTLQPWAQVRGVGLDIAGSGSAMADPDALGRALDNLVRNAIEVTAEGGRVEILTQETDRAVEVRVSDRGPGVPENHLTSLFEPFFSTKPGGTGLGLSLARAVLRAHGGEIDYRHFEGRTDFTMRLPRGPR